MNKPGILLLILAASFFAIGFADDPAAPPKIPIIYAIHSLLVGYICALLCFGDLARRRTTPTLWTALPEETALLVLLILPLGIPIYLFHSRPWREALKGCGLAVLFAALCLGLGWFGAFLRLNAPGG
jgi:hypothetical protein